MSYVAPCVLSLHNKLESAGTKHLGRLKTALLHSISKRFSGILNIVAIVGPMVEVSGYYHNFWHCLAWALKHVSQN